MGLASLRLDIGIFCNFLYSVLLRNAILGLDFLGLALSSSRYRTKSSKRSGWLASKHSTRRALKYSAHA